MKNGQAAIEYLITYGWVIIIISIVLAALYYAGFFKPRIIGICQFETGFTCTGYKISSSKETNTTHLSLKLEHSFGRGLLIEKIACVRGSSTEFSEVNESAKSEINIELMSGETSPILEIDCYEPMTEEKSSGKPGETFAGRLFIEWRYVDGKMLHITSAHLTGVIE